MGPNQEPTARFRGFGDFTRGQPAAMPQRMPGQGIGSQPGANGPAGYGAGPSVTGGISQLRRAAGLDGGGGSVTDAIQQLRGAAGLPVGQGAPAAVSDRIDLSGMRPLGGASSEWLPMEQRRAMMQQSAPSRIGGEARPGQDKFGGQGTPAPSRIDNAPSRPGQDKFSGQSKGTQLPPMSQNQQLMAGVGRGSRAFYGAPTSPYGAVGSYYGPALYGQQK